MLEWQPAISFVASALSFLYFVPYIITIFQGKTRPNRASWWIWSTNGAILCAGYAVAGGGNTLWALACAVFGQILIAILSLKYGEGGWNRFDRNCFIGAAIGLILWQHFNSPSIAIACSLLIDFIAALPTVKKCYHEPQTENFLAWAIYEIGSLLNLLTLSEWSLQLIAPPVYVFLINTTIVILLLRPKFEHSKSKPRIYLR